jgi:hypothetical protein
LGQQAAAIGKPIKHFLSGHPGPSSRRWDMSAIRLTGLLGLALLALSACSSTSSHSSAPAKTSPVTTGGIAATSPSSSTVPVSTTTGAVAASGPCYTGSWTSTNYAQVGQGITTNGGAGIHVNITASQLSFDFGAMQPVNVTGPVSGEGLFTGTEEAPVRFSPSGTFTVVAKGTSNVTFESKLDNAASYGTPIAANSFPSGGITGTYQCSGSTLTLKVPTPQGPTTLTLARG